MEENNLYAPPKTVVADVTSNNHAEVVRFFAVSPLKLVVLSVCTVGLYQLYWFYKNWVLIKKHSEPDIIPWGRALFGVFWCYRCFEFMREEERNLGVEPMLPAGPLAIAWIAAALAWRLPEWYSVLGFLTVLPLVPAQRHVNHINTLVAPEHDKNTRFGGWNWLAVVVGGIFSSLIIIGLAQKR